MRLLGATASDVGNLRDANQDRAFFRGATAALADGMGGHQGGERAAELAIDEFKNSEDHLSENDLVQLVVDANSHVHSHAVDNGLPGMGTTLVALTLHDDDTITIANVGDSRAYWLRGEYMTQITEDHSFVEDLVRQGRLEPEEAAVHPQRNILTRAVGIGAEVEVDRFAIEEPMVGDRFLLCSDGLFNEVSEDDIRRILVETEGSHVTAAALIKAALDTPCRDNVTVTVVDVVDNDHPGVADFDDPTDVDTVDEIDDPDTVRTDRTPTTQVPVVANAVLAEGQDGEEIIEQEEVADVSGSEIDAAHQPMSAPPSRRAAAAAGNTLVLDETTLDPEQVPSILDDGYTEDDPELYDETTELPLVGAPTPSGGRRSIMAIVAGAVTALAVLAGGYLAARIYAGSSFFIDDEGDQLVIFQGRRGGFLWFDPVDVGRFDVSRADLSDAELATVDQAEFDDLDSAEQLLEDLRDRQAAEAVEDDTDPATENEADSIDGVEGTDTTAPATQDSTETTEG